MFRGQTCTLLHFIQVIKKNQALVGILCRGPSSEMRLSGVYSNVHSREYQNQIGEAISRISLNTPGGILVFVSSYSLLENFTKTWKSSGLWNKICLVKTPFLEPKGSEKIDKVLKRFKTTIDQCSGFAKESKQLTGALLFGVYRGKVNILLICRLVKE